MEVLLLEHAAACSSSLTADTAAQLDNSSSSGSTLAVSAWCLGLYSELSGLFMPGSQGQVVAGGLQQYLSSCGAVEQRSVSGLLAALRAECAGQQGCSGLFLDASEMPGVCMVLCVMPAGCWKQESHDNSGMLFWALMECCVLHTSAIQDISRILCLLRLGEEA
jgi:hypothetical protein